MSALGAQPLGLGPGQPAAPLDAEGVQRLARVRGAFPGELDQLSRGGDRGRRLLGLPRGPGLGGQVGLGGQAGRRDPDDCGGDFSANPAWSPITAGDLGRGQLRVALPERVLGDQALRDVLAEPSPRPRTARSQATPVGDVGARPWRRR